MKRPRSFAAMSKMPSPFHCPSPLLVKGVAKESSWGRVGPASRIFSIASNSSDSSRLAEYWVGAHPSMPSRVVVDGSEIPFDLFIREHAASVLGDGVATMFGGELPFLLKILSIDSRHGLSIQAHPNPELAQRLHATDPTKYPDPRHKPEIGLPLTRVELLYGFKNIGGLRQMLTLFPELEEVTGKELLSVEENIYRVAVSKLFSLGNERTESLVTRIAQRIKKAGPRCAEAEAFTRLHPQYGDGDEGLLAIFLMNLVTVQPGQGIFIPANLPHAYLDGDLVECMACSDNVVRAGLTPKFKDVPTLLEMISYSGIAPTPLVPKADDEGFLVFPTPAVEFRIGYTPTGSKTYGIAKQDSVRLVMSLGKKSTVRDLVSGHVIELGDGDAALLPALGGPFEALCDNSSLYRAGIGVAA